MTDIEKLIDLLCRAHHNASAVMAGGEGSYHDGLKEEADYLIANDVTITVHGEWVEYQVPHIMCCSVCDWGTGVQSDFKYCPNCGAKMDGKNNVQRED